MGLHHFRRLQPALAAAATAGNDTIGAFGNDTVTDFHAGKAGHDVLRLSLGDAYDSFAEVIAAAHEANGSTVLDFGSHGTITLEGVTLAEIRADDILFV